MKKVTAAFEPDEWVGYINAIHETTSVQELVKLYAEPMGFTSALSQNIPPIGSNERQNSSRFLYYNVPETMISYIKKHYSHDVDPIAKHVLALGRPIWISDLLEEPEFSQKKTAEDIHYVIDMVGDGICCPSYNQAYWGYDFMSFGRPKEEFDDVMLWQVQTLCQVKHQQYVRLMRRLQQKVSLTSRELDVLELVALGKTNAEIADILNITSNTVAGYIKHIYLKLNTSDRVTTSLRAMSLNLIS